MHNKVKETKKDNMLIIMTRSACGGYTIYVSEYDTKTKQTNIIEFTYTDYSKANDDYNTLIN